jgi:hypothetical protein
MLKLHKSLIPLLLVCFLSSSCSVMMVASRASYRGDINVIQLGVQRSAVIAELGHPDNSTTLENGAYDDRYVLDPNAHRGVMKFFTALFYAAADFFTLFLTEFLFTPAEIAMKDKIVVYHLTYAPDQKLATMEKITP